MKMIVRECAKRVCDTLGIPRYWILDNLRELRMLMARVYAALPMQRLKIKRLERRGHLKLLFGCGETSYPGWTAIDCRFLNTVDLLLDLRRPLPFSANCVEHCYSEHVLEHLFPEEGMRHLREVWRVLKPGGVYRVVVPDAGRFFRRYANGNGDFFRLAFPWTERPMQAIWHIVNWGGAHHNVLDFAELAQMARTAGFTVVRESGANLSHLPELRIDKPEPQRIAESLYAELVK